MPAYNFQKQFMPMILSGRKPHTIRRRRKHPTNVGDLLSLYTGMRTKSCVKIADVICVKVTPINFYPEHQILLDGQYMTTDEIEKLAQADGFDSVNMFFKFFEEHYTIPTFGFEIIEWNPTSFLRGVCSLGFDMRSD